MNSICLRQLLILLPALCLLTACATLQARGEYDYQVRSDLVYAEPDGEALYADLYVPEGEGPFPGVVVIHGGGWNSGERADMKRFASELAANGFVAMNISYRLAPGHIHPAQLEDGRAAVRWLRQQAGQFKVDASNIGAFGYSAGAHLAMLLGVNPTAAARVQAIVAGSGPTDLRKYPDSPLVKDYLGGPPEGREALYRDASPIVHVSPDDAPAYLYHGKRDTLVEVEQSLDMAGALEEQGVAVEMDVQPFGHVLTYFLDGDVMQRAVRFLRTHLGS